MSPQVEHALKYALLFAAIGALGALNDHLDVLNLDPQWVILVAALLPALIRVLEGMQDATRAAKFDVLPRDVGYQELKAFRGEPLPKHPVR
jgi:hypothetical protein